MLFEKDGERFEVTEPAHIDCFKSKGWKEVKEKPKKTEEKK